MFRFKFSKGIKIVLISHAIFWLATSFIGPFLEIFYIRELQGVTLTNIGVASSIFLLSFGALEPLVGILADRIDGLKDELILVIIGTFIRGITFILFSFSTNVYHLYLFQFVLGLSRALGSPTDFQIYSRLMGGRKNGATLWGINESIINISAALGAFIGGYLSEIYGIRMLLRVAGLFILFSGVIYTKTKSEITFTNNCSTLVEFFAKTIQQIFKNYDFRSRVYVYSAELEKIKLNFICKINYYNDQRARKPYFIYRVGSVNLNSIWKNTVKEM